MHNAVEGMAFERNLTFLYFCGGTLYAFLWPIFQGQNQKNAYAFFSFPFL